MKDIRSIILRAKKENRWLFENEAMDLLEEYGISCPEYFVSTTPEEAVDDAAKIGFPVAMKIISQDILHKTDAGCVKLHIKNGNEALEAYSQIIENAREFKVDARIEGIITYPCLPKGTEVIVGVTEDAQFGKTIMFGVGGIWVEVLKDVSFRIMPLTIKDAFEMIQEIQAYSLLKGVRGKNSRDIDAIANTIMKVSNLCTDYPEIKEMDLNPIFVYEDGIKVVDARILVG